VSSLLAIQIPWRGQSDLVPALAALVGLNVYFIQAHRLPKLYTSGVRYQREGRKSDGTFHERWLTAPEVIRIGVADCEDLAAYLAAQRRLEGDATAMAIPRRSSIGWHIVVQRGDGTIEDPSKVLGMGGDG
jgi:hypothetical protein